MSQDTRKFAQPISVATGGQKGIMVLSSIGRVLYANQAAHEFIRQLNCTENGHSTDGAFPASVADLLDDMLTSLTDSGPERLAAKVLAMDKAQPVRVQVFGLPGRGGIHRSRIVLTIQEMARPLSLDTLS